VRGSCSNEMAPRPAMHYRADERSRNAISLGEDGLLFSGGDPCTDGENGPRGEFGVGVVGTAFQQLWMLTRPVAVPASASLRMKPRPVTVSAACSTLSDPVGDVCGVRPQEEMCRIDATRSVTAMADAHPVGDWTYEDLVGNAVRSSRLAMISEDSIAALRQASYPQSTTRIRLGHAQPLEPRFDALPHGLHYTRASDTTEGGVPSA